MSTEEPVDEGEVISNGRVSMANSMLATIGGLTAIAAGLGIESWQIHPLLMPLGFLWCFVYALRVADAYVQMGS